MKPSHTTPTNDATSSDIDAELPCHQADILRRQIATVESKTGVAVLLRYASIADILILAVSTICAVGSGASLPIMTVVFGDLQHTFQVYFHGTGEMTYETYMDQLAEHVLYLVYIAVAGFVAVYVSTVGFIYTGEHISAKIREHYLQSCLRQNIAFFDKVGVGEITTRITADTNLIQDGISEKISLFLAAFSTFLTAFIIGFVKYWKFTLIMSSAAVALIVNITAGSHYMTKNTQYSLQCYAEGGNLASEAISTVRSIVAFGAQGRMAVQYDRHLAKAQVYGIRVKRASAVKVGCMSLIISLCYALAFWQGGGYIVNGIVPLSTVVTITMAIMMGTFQLGNMAPNIQAFTTALAAARKIFNTIDRVSPLDSSSEEGQKLEKVQGHIRLQDIVHIYPSRPQVTVMRNMTLNIPSGKTTALVGESGSGKSTIIGLIERFYDPVEGRIFLDGHDVNTLNLRWLRQQMALVSQEPTLFAATIYENICYGLVGDRFKNESEERKHMLVLKAARMAHAHAFISNLPDGYGTYVGDRGILLSGGQKQRIAIARAIVSDPKILLLDEATSALDTKSERVVQAALDNATQGRTTIVIAHRLASVRNAHNIVVMSKGQIAEQGTHNELLEKGGIYHDLVAAQTIYKANNMTSTEEDIIKEEDEIDFQRETGKANQQVVTKQESAVAVQDVPATADITEQSLQQHRPPKPKQATFWSLIKMTAKFNKPETKTMLFGLGVSIIYAGCNPFSLLCFAKEMVILSQTITQSTRDRIKKDSDFWASMYVLLAFLQTILCSAQGIAFAKCSEMLIRRVRYQSFKAILHQDVSFFDYKNHSEGALTSFLATEPTHLAGLSGVTLGTILTLVATLITGMAVSLAVGWKLALVCISVIPLLLGFGFCRFWILTHFQRRSKAAYQESAAYAAEAISAIRTVAPLTREDAVLKTYRDSLTKQQRLSLISVLKSSALFAASQSLYFACLALGFWFGGSLIGRFEYDIFDFYLVFMTIIIGVQSAGTAFAFAPDMGKADQAAREIKALFDRKPVINSFSEEGEQVKTMEGSVEFRDVFFRYPTRLEQPVLQGLNLTIHPGQYVALVGASGCGKSTVISLLERFYDPLSGEVIVDGRDIKSFNVGSYRSFISLVSQEPTLYQGTIKENILLGALKDEVSINAIEAACRAANIYDFIISLPNGFDTMVGNRGSLLSGGQKQRIAIARALIRDPKILLLDEATSALDSESEHVVQAALDIAAEGRTTIAVAHRLSTIQRADMIFVFDQGRIVESGTHSELLNNKGRYAELVNQQSLDKHS